MENMHRQQPKRKICAQYVSGKTPFIKNYSLHCIINTTCFKSQKLHYEFDINFHFPK